jgi:hypothetical protein
MESLNVPDTDLVSVFGEPTTAEHVREFGDIFMGYTVRPTFRR